jgi:putative aldouronate transport system permease protein
MTAAARAGTGPGGSGPMSGRGARSSASRASLAGLRACAAALFIMIFIPIANPARISEKINRNVSLFTSGLFKSRLTSEMGRILQKGWVRDSTIGLLMLSSLASCVGVLASTAAACLSAGNSRLKRIAFAVGLVGGAIASAGLIGIMRAYGQIMASPEPAKALPLFPGSIPVMAILVAALALCSVLGLVFSPSPARDERAAMASSRQLFLLLLPFLILAFLFSYLPLLGWRYAFYDYSPGATLSADKFAGLRWFAYLFESQSTRNDLVRVLLNTLAMSGLGIATSWCPMAFAVLLSEIRNSATRRAVQTLTTIPNFISWVLVYAVAYAVFSTDGFLSGVMVDLGLWESGKNLLLNPDHVWLQMLGWSLWKSLGWGAIMYIAAIAAIDPQLYEAATMDGAGRFRKIWNVTLPGLIPTYMVLLLLQIAGMLNNGMEQYLVFENPVNTGAIAVLDLYVYKIGIGLGLIPLSTVVGMVKSVVSVLLLFGANAISRFVRGTGIV